MFAISGVEIILPNPIPTLAQYYYIQIMADSSNLDAERRKLANLSVQKKGNTNWWRGLLSKRTVTKGTSFSRIV